MTTEFTKCQNPAKFHRTEPQQTKPLTPQEHTIMPDPDNRQLSFFPILRKIIDLIAIAFVTFTTIMAVYTATLSVSSITVVAAIISLEVVAFVIIRLILPFPKSPKWSSINRIGNNKILRSSYVWLFLVPILAKFLLTQLSQLRLGIAIFLIFSLRSVSKSP